MSRAYRISVSETAKRHIEIKDGIQVNLEILPVLPAQRMIEILAAELKTRGFEIDGTIAIRTEPDGINIRIDMENSAIEVTLADSADIETSREVEAVIEEEVIEERKKVIKEKLLKELNREIDRKHQQARQELTDKLKRRLGDIQTEMDQVINATIAAGLKEKAAQLGDIEEVIESGDGSISIRINV